MSECSSKVAIVCTVGLHLNANDNIPGMFKIAQDREPARRTRKQCKESCFLMDIFVTLSPSLDENHFFTQYKGIANQDFEKNSTYILDNTGAMNRSSNKLSRG